MYPHDIEDIDIDWWQERDRASVVAYIDDDRRTELFESWDEDVYELIEDGFLTWDDDDSVIEYMIHIGIIEIDPDDPNYFRVS